MDDKFAWTNRLIWDFSGRMYYRLSLLTLHIDARNISWRLANMNWKELTQGGTNLAW